MVRLRQIVDRRGRVAWEEVHPERCPGCQHPYRGGHVAVGYLTCGCEGAERGAHRTLYCRDCHTEVLIPLHYAELGPRQAGEDDHPDGCPCCRRAYG